MDTPTTRTLLDIVIEVPPEQVELIARARPILELDKGWSAEEGEKICESLAEILATHATRLIIEICDSRRYLQ